MNGRMVRRNGGGNACIQREVWIEGEWSVLVAIKGKFIAATNWVVVYLL